MAKTQNKSLGGREGDVQVSPLFLHIGSETEGVLETKGGWRSQYEFRVTMYTNNSYEYV